MNKRQKIPSLRIRWIQPDEGSRQSVRRRVFLTSLLFSVLVFSIMSLLPAKAATMISDFRLPDHWAPVWFQDTAEVDDLGYRADYITNFNFDVDWNATNNWNNLIDGGYELKAYIYYWIVETEQYYFIGYVDFHPIDWAYLGPGTLNVENKGREELDSDLLPPEEHENDMEGCLLAIRKDGSEFGSLEYCITVAHLDFPLYHGDEIENLSNLDQSQKDALDDLIRKADIQFSIPENGQRPCLFVEPKGHGVYILDGKGEFPFAGEDGVVYLPGELAQEPKGEKSEAVIYELKLIDELWGQNLSETIKDIISKLGGSLIQEIKGFSLLNIIERLGDRSGLSATIDDKGSSKVVFAYEIPEYKYYFQTGDTVNLLVETTSDPPPVGIIPWVLKSKVELTHDGLDDIEIAKAEWLEWKYPEDIGYDILTDLWSNVSSKVKFSREDPLVLVELDPDFGSGFRFKIPVHLDGAGTASLNLRCLYDISPHVGSEESTVEWTFKILGPGPPIDLTTTSVTAPSSAKPGDPINVSFTIKNQGTAPSGSFYNRISLSKEPHGTDILLDNFSMGSIAAGSSSSDTQTVQIPGDTSPGDYYVTVYADGFQVIDESNEGNNIGSTPIIIGSIGTPDLVVTYVDAPSSAYPGADINVSFTVKNQGTAASGGFHNRISLDDFPLGESPMNSIAAGSSSSDTRTVRIPTSVSPGDYDVIVYADCFQEVDESNENNNTKSKSITIKPLPDKTAWEFNTFQDREGWRTEDCGVIVSWSVNWDDNGALIILVDGKNPYIVNDPLSINAANYNTIRIAMVSHFNTGDGTVAFKTSASPNYDSNKIIFHVNHDNNLYVYDIVVGEHINWKGTITGLRIAPATEAHSNIAFDYIKLIDEPAKRPSLIYFPSGGLKFGDIKVGQTKELTIEITNYGVSVLRGTVDDLVGSHKDQFSIISGRGEFEVENYSKTGDKHLVKIRFSPSSSGAKTAAVRVISTDPSGPSLDIPLKGTGIIIDTTPPDTTITSGPSGTIDYNDVIFTYTGSDDITETPQLVYSYFLQGYDSGWSSYTSSTGKNYYDLPDASYTFYVKAKDEAGNPDPSPASRSFQVETTPPKYTLTTSVSPSGSGSISLNPPGGTYDAGTVVTLEAIPNTGWKFDHWSGHLSGSENPKQITMDSDKTVTANFTKIKYTLTVSSTDCGSVSLNPPGGTYDAGTVVTLEAIPNPDCRFDYWSGDLSGTDNPTTITMDSDKTVTAIFECTLSPNVSPPNSGGVSLNPSGGIYTVELW
ncbi:hypothetical protein H8E77_18320 [bacterium]|nr:hypothetical protein [bacterium]